MEKTYLTPEPLDYYRRLKTSGLSSASLGVLRQVAAWREQTARTRNLPRGWVIRDQSIVEIARRRPSSIQNLKQIRSLKPHQIGKDGESIVQAVKSGLQNPIEEAAPEKVRFKVPPHIDSVARLLEAWLYARSLEAEIAPSMLATRGDLKTLAAGHHRGVLPELPLLDGWRRDLAGQDLLDILDGKRALQVDGGKLSAVASRPDSTTENPDA